MLLSFTDFLAFKQMFLDYKAVSIVFNQGDGYVPFRMITLNNYYK